MPPPALLDVLDAWDLLREGNDLGRYSVGDWKKIGEAVSLSAADRPRLGAIHLGLTDGIEMMEGRAPISSIASYVLAYDQPR
jgi:hypothetical protein